MGISSFLYVANWKMQFSFNEALSFYKKNKNNFDMMTQKSGHRIVLCPSFDVLYAIIKEAQGSLVFFGAQDCSSHNYGAYTGQICAESLAQIGCSYCIIGHSEYRKYAHSTDLGIGKKAVCLIKQNIKPIICVGETWQEYEHGVAEKIIERQIDAVLLALQQANVVADICIAYEPIWSIGSGKTPPIDYIKSIFKYISLKLEVVKNITSLMLLYGGSVTDENVANLKKISELQGLLVGGASLDFQKFEKIVT